MVVGQIPIMTNGTRLVNLFSNKRIVQSPIAASNVVIPK